MESLAATMAAAPCCCLPEEIVVWEILVRLPPISLLRFRAVCRAWRRATSTRDFLLAHHARQPSLPMVLGEPAPGSDYGGARYEDFLSFDHRAADAQLQPVARLGPSFDLESSCDGLLVLSKRAKAVTYLSVCNPVTRQHAPLVDFSSFTLLGMYLHRPTGEYRLLLHRKIPRGSLAGNKLPKGKIGCYVLALGSGQLPRYIGSSKAAAALHFHKSVRVHGSLHWLLFLGYSEGRLVLIFDTTAESFRQMRAPVVGPKSDIFDMDGTLGVYSYDNVGQLVCIWMLDHQGEVWKPRYRVVLSAAVIRGQLGRWDGSWDLHVVSVADDVLLLVSRGGSMFYINTDGELVDSFHRDGQHIFAWDFQFKQTLVPHKFFTALEDFSVDASPFL